MGKIPLFFSNIQVLLPPRPCPVFGRRPPLQAIEDCNWHPIVAIQRQPSPVGPRVDGDGDGAFRGGDVLVWS